MTTTRSKVLIAATVLTAVCMPGIAQADPLAHPTSATAGVLGRIIVIQAVPDARVDLTINGKSAAQDADEGTILGPFTMAPGSYELVFSGGRGLGRVVTRVRVLAGSSNDVVLHRPATVDGDAVVNTYRTPTTPIGPGKSRLLLAHTATVAPADVRFDGKTVFSNIANGEFAQADVPSGMHKVELVPTGKVSPPLLGPLVVRLAPYTATMVYAVGNPATRSMKKIVHTVPLRRDGSVAPDRIATGSAGLVPQVRIVTFATLTLHLDPARAVRVAVVAGRDPT